MVQAARIFGAATVIGVDPIATRRQTASELGATVTVDPNSVDPIALVREVTSGRGADVVLCSVAAGEGALEAFDATRLDGRLVTVAGFPPAGGDTAKWVSGNWVCYDRDWPTIIEHVTAGRFTLDPYVTHTFPLTQIEDAFRVRIHDPEHSLKVVVTMDEHPS
jgi:S-(hydroxymethyl)glutathione dehydrogenase/alcohol dehydrogenase